jgi:hypothetical protein
MERSRVDRILNEWAAVASQAHRPSASPQGVVMRSSLSGATLAGAGLVVLVVVGAAVWLGNRGPSGPVGATPSTVPSASAPATAAATPTAATTPTATATPTAAAIGPCDPAQLAARITMWEGAAGHRIAHLEMTNTGSSACTLETMARPQLVDGRGTTLIDGASPSSSATLKFAPGGVVTTLVQDGNYCGPAPKAPVSVVFVLSDGRKIVAAPLSPTDATLPPCNSAPGTAGTIDMHPWAS